MPTKKQLAAQLAALNAKTAKDVAAAQAEIDATNATIAAANQPVIEEMPGFIVGLPGNIPVPSTATINQSIENDTLLPGILKSGFTAGPLPEKYQGMLGNPDILGWRVVTDANGTERIEVQTGIGTTQTYGAPVGGNTSIPTSPTGPTNATTFTTSDGKTFNNYADYLSWQSKLDSEKSARQSAYDLLYSQFKQYGLESLVEGIKDLIQSNVSPSEFAIRLQDTDAYKKRFAANQDRIKQGLRALTPAEYIGLEDQYQNIMRNYGLPASYWSKDSMGTQAGFNKFIANDVSAAELEDRIATAQKRVINADVNVINALRQFYPDITNADILAYTLDPTNALENIKRKVTAAEIGGAALGQGLATSAASAEDLAKYGITKAQAQQGYGTIAEFLPSATKLGDIYAGQGLGAYDQATAEKEVFGTAGAAEAARKRKKLSELERATFGGQAGTAQGALARDRAGSI